MKEKVGGEGAEPGIRRIRVRGAVVGGPGRRCAGSEGSWQRWLNVAALVAMEAATAVDQREEAG